LDCPSKHQYSKKHGEIMKKKKKKSIETYIYHKPNPFDSLDREAAEGGGSKELQQFTVEHFGRGSMQESSYNVGVVLRSPSSPSGIGQSEMVGLGVGEEE
jgi:hypothetical protein